MTKKRAQTPQKQRASSTPSALPSELPTFLDHVRELRRRLFWAVAVILVASSAAYPFLDGIISILTKPLGSQQLYYLTPIGGFSFSIQLCLYAGIAISVPFIMYHLYRYLEPLMGKWRKPALYYVGFSSFFAAMGLLFAYFISLPSALHFLTGLNLNNIQAMLTVDSYLTFVMTYMLGAALLFQIPLLLLIINNMTPLKPIKLLKLQKFVIIGAFIVAAIISPTPDIMNQLILALPIVVMYQLGVGFVWVQNRSRLRRMRRDEAQKRVTQEPLFAIKKPLGSPPQSLGLLSSQITTTQPVYARHPSQLTSAHTKIPPKRRTVHVDGFVAVSSQQRVSAKSLVASADRVYSKVTPINSARAKTFSDASGVAAIKPSMAKSRVSAPHPRSVAAPSRSGTILHNRPLQVPRRTSVDGFIPYRSMPTA